MRKLDTLWDAFSALSQLVDEAETLAAKNGLLRNTDGDVAALLTEESIRLKNPAPAGSSVALLAGIDEFRTYTPAQVLATMQQDFTEVQERLRSIVVASENFAARLESLRTEERILTQRAAENGCAANMDLLRMPDPDDIATDPIGKVMQLEAFEQAINQQRQDIERIDQEKASLAATLDNALKDLEALSDIVARSRAAHDEALATIKAPCGLVAPMAATALVDLRDWLGTLQKVHQRGNWQSVKVGVHRWLGESRRIGDREAKAYASNRAPLDERSALRSKLRALEAKELRPGKTLSKQAGTLATLMREASGLLRCVPTDLAQARRLVASLEVMVFPK
jgi:hypothetical protein